jgi:hypothetical protein
MLELDDITQPAALIDDETVDRILAFCKVRTDPVETLRDRGPSLLDRPSKTAGLRDVIGLGPE